MTPDRWRQIVELFDEAVDWPPEDREACLRGRCAGDDELYEAVSRMLVADEEAPPAPDGESPAGPAPAADAALGRYRLIERIGRGGFSEVYRAWDPELGREVAVKTSHSQRRDLRLRFAREAQIVARLVHPNITVVHDFGVEGETAYLVQELLDGRDLRLVIDREEPASLSTRLGWLLAIARGLDHAHRHGVVHRDVKPSNLRVCEDGRVKILDFGVAALLGEATRLTVAGSVVGTAAYMAPEQVRGDAVDARADLYSFGAVAYELLCGEPAHRADSLPGLLYQIVHTRPEPLAPRLPDEFPPSVSRIVDRCLDKRPDRRPEDFGPVIEALEAAAGAPAAPAGGERGRVRPERRRTAAVLWAAGLIAGLTAGAFAWRAATRQAPPPVVAAVTQPVATGTLVVDARPWGEVTSIRDGAGRELAPPSSRQFTPLAMTLPAGEYTVAMIYPGVDGDRTCTAVVESAASSRCSAHFLTVAADEYLAPERLAGAGQLGPEVESESAGASRR